MGITLSKRCEGSTSTQTAVLSNSTHEDPDVNESNETEVDDKTEIDRSELGARGCDRATDDTIERLKMCV